MTKTAAKAHKGKKDLHGNPEGTTYSENGTPEHASFDGLTTPPQDAERPILYNEDGSVFAPPADFEKKMLTFKADITGLNIAIGKAENMRKMAEDMKAEAEEEDKPVFDKNINSCTIAIDSNKAKKLELETAMKELELSAITPAERARERELQGLLAQKVTIEKRIAELQSLKKVNNVVPTPKAPKAAPADRTAEQQALLDADVAAFGSQGKAIVEKVKLGWRNAEIAKYYGIPDASVPGPKNAFRQSAEGQTYVWNDTNGTCSKA